MKLLLLCFKDRTGLSIILVDPKSRHGVRVSSDFSVLCESDLTLSAKLEFFHLLSASALGFVQILKSETYGGVKSQFFLFSEGMRLFADLNRGMSLSQTA